MKKNYVKARDAWFGLPINKRYEFFTLDTWQTYYKYLSPDPIKESLLTFWIIEDE